jgi:hypothetical protein
VLGSARDTAREPCQVTLLIACSHPTRQEISRKNEALASKFATPEVAGIVGQGGSLRIACARRSDSMKEAGRRVFLE